MCEGGFRVRCYPSRKGKGRYGRRIGAQGQRGRIRISDVEGFIAYYVVYAPDDTVTAISIFNDYAGAEESNRRALAWIEQKSYAPARRASHGDGWAGDRAHLGIAG